MSTEFFFRFIFNEQKQNFESLMVLSNSMDYGKGNLINAKNQFYYVTYQLTYMVNSIRLVQLSHLASPNSITCRQPLCYIVQARAPSDTQHSAHWPTLTIISYLASSSQPRDPPGPPRWPCRGRHWGCRSSCSKSEAGPWPEMWSNIKCVVDILDKHFVNARCQAWLLYNHICFQ